MSYYLENIFKTRLAFILIFITMFTLNVFSAQKQIEPKKTVKKKPVKKQIEFKEPKSKIPMVIELKDPLEIEQSQLFFPKNVFKEFKLEYKEYRETPFRRGEIIFFISYPYIYMYNLVILETIMKTRMGAKKGLSSYHYIFMLIISGIVSGLIAYDDNVYIYSNRKERIERKQRLSKRFDFEIMIYKF